MCFLGACLNFYMVVHTASCLEKPFTLSVYIEMLQCNNVGIQLQEPAERLHAVRIFYLTYRDINENLIPFLKIGDSSAPDLCTELA